MRSEEYSMRSEDDLYSRKDYSTEAFNDTTVNLGLQSGSFSSFASLV